MPITTVDNLASLRRIVEDGEDDLVLVGADADLDLALELAAESRVTHPCVGVILLRRRVDSAVLRDALRAGVREVVNGDDLAGLREACERSLEVSRKFRELTGSVHVAEQREGKVVTVFAAKGGTGKTTISTNLAAALSRAGQRVCLFDLDLAFGDVSIVLQLQPSRTVADVVSLSRIDEAAVRSLVTPYNDTLDVIAAPLVPGQYEQIEPRHVTDLLTVAKRLYDVVIVDSPPAFTEYVLAAFDQTDDFLLLATLDVPALKNLKLTMETLDLLAYPRDRWHVVLNRADAHVGLLPSDVEQTLNMKIAAHVPSSRAVPDAVNRGVPVLIDKPKHAVSAAVTALAATLVSNVAVPERKRLRLRVRQSVGATA
jgi:pilus assembly protein CpaE